MNSIDPKPVGVAEEREGRRNVYLGWLTLILAGSVMVYRPWVALASTLIILVWIFGGGFRQHAARLRSHRLTLAILVFIGLNLVSLAWSSDPGAGFRYLTKYHYLLLIPILASSIQPAFRRAAYRVYVIAAVVSASVSFAVMASWIRLGDAHPGNPSPFMSHLDFSLLLALASLLLLSLTLFTEMTPKLRAAWLCCFAIVTGGLVINIGRGGQLAFVCGLFALAVFWARRRSLRVGLGALAGVILFTALLWVSAPRLQSRVAEAQGDLKAALSEQRYEGNLGGRVAATIVASEIFRSHPVLGTGIGGNIPAMKVLLDSRFEEFKPAIYWYRHFHSQYTQVATELGLVGLLSLGWIFWELFRGPYPKPLTSANATILAVVYLVGFIGEPYFHKQIPLVTFALFAGLISAAQLDGRDRDKETNEDSPDASQQEEMKV